MEELTKKLGTTLESVHLVDGFPVPVCQFAKAKRCAKFKEEARYGHCAAKKQTYYGFHG